MCLGSHVRFQKPDARLFAARPTRRLLCIDFHFLSYKETKHNGKLYDPDAEIRTGFTWRGS